MKLLSSGKTYRFALLLALLVPILAACGNAAQAPVRETVVVVQTAPPEQQTVVVRETVAGATAAPAAEPFTTPHPILGDLRVRQAIAHCTNRLELIKSVYPFLGEEEQKRLLMDTNLPQGHWALATEGITTYPFDAAKGNALLEEAGWKLAEGAELGSAIRVNASGDPLELSFTTTNAQFRQTWAAVMERQLLSNCGIQILRTHAPGSWWFGDTTGLARRDFEIGAFAWVGEPDPGGQTLYACDQIPLPSNNWEGQNSMGWCNETASKAIKAANNTLDREERIKQYAIFQQEFTKDMPSLPLFNRAEAEAANKDLKGFQSDPTEYVTANIHEWELPGKDTVVIGLTQEPASLWGLVESAAVQRVVSFLIGSPSATTYDYDYQPFTLKTLPTIDNGGATLTAVDVKAGDKVWSTAGEPVDLAAGVEIVNSDGETIKYESGTVKMNQLVVNFEYVDGLKWADGEAIKQADFELGAKIDCDPDSGAVSFNICDSRQKIDFKSDTAYTISYLPGVAWPEYSIYTLSAYPSHQVIADGEFKGQKLADVPAKAWATLPEIAENPLSSGPYTLVSWDKGQRMTFEANPNYFKGAPKIQRVIVQFFEDTNQAVAQLLTGNVDVLGSETLGAGAEVETVLKAAAEGKVQAEVIASPTWEHADFNLFVK
jgi:ABC-type transport system substrate-binding protein